MSIFMVNALLNQYNAYTGVHFEVEEKKDNITCENNVIVSNKDLGFAIIPMGLKVDFRHSTVMDGDKVYSVIVI